MGHVCNNVHLLQARAVLSHMLLIQTILLKPKGIERCQILSVRDIVSKHTNSLTWCFKNKTSTYFHSFDDIRNSSSMKHLSNQTRN